jgi:hypothetical protein
MSLPAWIAISLYALVVARLSWLIACELIPQPDEDDE